MSCNCNTSTECSNCCQGIPCNCPPVYSVPTAAVPCTCCPNGYTFRAASQGYPSGSCINNADGKTIVETIPCVSCEDVIATDCVIYNGTIPIACPDGVTNVYGIIAGDTLTTIISKMCITNENVLESMLSAIGLSTRALSGFCNLVEACGSIPGVTTPVLGPISFTIP